MGHKNQDPLHLPEPPTDPPAPTEAEYYDAEWADRQEEKWNALSVALEFMGKIRSELKSSNEHKLICKLGGHRNHSLGFLLNVMESTIKIKMQDIVYELLDRGFAPPEEAKTV